MKNFASLRGSKLYVRRIASRLPTRSADIYHKPLVENNLLWANTCTNSRMLTMEHHPLVSYCWLETNFTTGKTIISDFLVYILNNTYIVYIHSSMCLLCWRSITH